MSKWIRGIYNAAANFNMSGSLRAASGRTMDRDHKLVREECEQSNECDKPCEPCKSDSCSTATTPCSRTAACATTGTSSCRSSATASSVTEHNDNNVDTVIIGNNVIVTSSRELNTVADYIEHEYAEYTATIRTQGQGDSTGVWVSDESRNFKHSNNATGTNVEHITGIPTGVTI